MEQSLTFLNACAYIVIVFKHKKMTERLATPPRESAPSVDPEAATEIDSVESNLDQETVDLFTEARERVARLLEELGPPPDEAPTRELPAASDIDKTVEPPSDETPPLSQDEIYNTYANNIAYTAEKEKLIDPRSRLRKIGDGALRLNERLGRSYPAKLLARWGIVPPIGTRHTQKGFNFSAWMARKYVKAQEARKSREERIRTGFLSPEDKARLSAMDETTPEKIAQDKAYDTYQENLKATAKRDKEE